MMTIYFNGRWQGRVKRANVDRRGRSEGDATRLMVVSTTKSLERNTTTLFVCKSLVYLQLFRVMLYS